jgi:hypothetical protein
LKGGVFRSDKTLRNPLDTETANQLQKATSGIIDNLRGYANLLGINASALESFTFDFKLSTKGLKPEEIQAKLNEAFGEFTGRAAQQLFAGTGFERAIQEFNGSAEEWSEFLQDYVPLIAAVKEASDVLPILTKAIYELSKAPKEVQQALTGIAGYLSPKITEAYRQSLQSLNGAFSTIARPAPSLLSQWQALGGQIRAWTDTTQQGIVRLASLTQQRYDVETKLLQSVIDLARGAAEQFGQAGRDFLLDSLTTAEKIDFYDTQGAKAREALATETDPEKIAKLTADLLDAERRGYELQRDLLREQASANVDAINAAKDKKLNSLGEGASQSDRDRINEQAQTEIDKLNAQLETDLRALATAYRIVAGEDNTLVQGALDKTAQNIIVDRDAASPESTAAALAQKANEAAQIMIDAARVFSAAVEKPLTGEIKADIVINGETVFTELVPIRN